jgi:hypothetical protein
MSASPFDTPPPQVEQHKQRARKAVLLSLVFDVLFFIFLGLQLIPVHLSSPPGSMQVNWDSLQTRELAYRACMDCHSNETQWPWYAHIAPASWLVYYDVMRGREVLNLSVHTPGEAAAPDLHAGDYAYRLGELISTLAGGRVETGEELESGAGEDDLASAQSHVHFTGEDLGEHLAEHIQNYEMPPARYLVLHPGARLSDAERQQLLDGLLKSLGLVQ